MPLRIPPRPWIALLRREIQRPGTSDRVTLHKVHANVACRIQTCGVLHLLGDHLKFSERASLMVAVTMAWFTLSRARFCMNEPSIFR